jgi:putative DNA primase/helicase
VSPEGIPQELKDLAQWVCWTWQSRDGKWTKIPVDPKSKAHAKTNDPGYWRTFQEAMETYEKHREVYAGVGFVFTEGDPYCGVDFDDTQDPAPALALRSYAERSPSGTGFKAIVKAKLADGSKNRKGNLEVYDQGRYFALTGHRVDGAPATIAERQVEIDELYGAVFGKAPSPAPASTSTRAGQPPELSDDDEIITLGLAERTDKFRRLFDGDLTEYGGDDSRADEALCCKIAFYTRDPGQIDRVFRRSKLYREKWDRPDYRSGTITKAIALQKEHYQSASATHSDGTNAERLVKKYGDELRYCPAWRKWITWGNYGWRVEQVDCVTPRMRAVVKDMLAHARERLRTAKNAAAAQTVTIATDEDVQRLASEAKKREKPALQDLNWAITSDSKYHLDAAIALAARTPGIQTTADEWNREPMLSVARIRSDGLSRLRSRKYRIAKSPSRTARG